MYYMVCKFTETNFSVDHFALTLKALRQQYMQQLGITNTKQCAIIFIQSEFTKIPCIYWKTKKDRKNIFFDFHKIY